MKIQMKISVITVCYNSVNTIEKAIKSVVSQDYSDKEYIVVDGGSTDGTIDIIKKYDKNINKWISEPDKGIFDAMNKGIGMATGDVIAFLNSDDWYLANALVLVYDAFVSNDCDCVCCDNYVMKEDGSKVYYDVSDLCIEDMYKRMIYFHSAIFARKEMFQKEHNFDLSYKIAADYDWMLRIMQKGARILYLHKPVFTFCYGGISSVNEIECAREARKIATYHLPIEKKSYINDIDDRYFEIAACASDREWINRSIKAIIKNDLPIILWGAGYRGKQCLTWLQKADIKVLGIVDTNEDKWGNELQGVLIYSPQILKDKISNLIITPDKCIDDIQKQIFLLQEETKVYVLKKLWREMVENFSKSRAL